MAKKTISCLEIKATNFLIYNAIREVNLNDVDWSFVKSVQGTLALWRTVYSSIRSQLKLNPNDVDGFSITPRWVRKIYQEYRNSDYHDMWNPKGTNLETVPNTIKDIISVNQEGNLHNIELLAYSVEDNFTLHVISKKATGEYLRGYLDAVKADKVYKITLEELHSW